MVRELCAWKTGFERIRVSGFTVPMKESDQIHRFWLSGRSTEYVPSAPVQPGPFWVKNVSNVVSGVPAPGAGGSVHWASAAAMARERMKADRRSKSGISDQYTWLMAGGTGCLRSPEQGRGLRPNCKNQNPGPGRAPDRRAAQGSPGIPIEERSSTRACSRGWIAGRGDTERHTFPAQLPFALRYVPTSIPRFVSFEVRTIDTLGRLGLLATFWRRALIAVVRMETVIHVALEVVSAMKPRAGANETVPVKPFGTIVASGRTGVRSDVIVTIGTIRGYSNGDAVLSLCFGGASRETDCSNSS